MATGTSRGDAWELVCEWTQSDSLRRHMLAVEAAMRAYAPRFDGDVELWGLTGLLHDLDYERYPDLDTGHPRFGMEELRRRGYPEELVRAVGSQHVRRNVDASRKAIRKRIVAGDELYLWAVARSAKPGVGRVRRLRVGRWNSERV